MQTLQKLELSHRLLYHPNHFPKEAIRAEHLEGLLEKLRREGLAKEHLPSQKELQRQGEYCKEKGIRLILSGEAEYPAALLDLPQIPPLLFTMGSLPTIEKVSIVGSRRCSSRGQSFARQLAERLSGEKLCIVSGLARGIDRAAHEGAIEKGETLAVLGGGLDCIYPPEHGGLARKIMKEGALISEFPPGCRPRPFHFPRRNRIIAALSRVLILVEAGEKRGALSTAMHARELGRSVMVAPSCPLNPAARGSNRLLLEGALPVLSAGEVLEELGWGKQGGRVWNCERAREEGITDLETLSLKSGWPLDRVLRELSDWERSGEVRRETGGRFHFLALAEEGPAS